MSQKKYIVIITRREKSVHVAKRLLVITVKICIRFKYKHIITLIDVRILHCADMGSGTRRTWFAAAGVALCSCGLGSPVRCSRAAARRRRCGFEHRCEE